VWSAASSRTALTARLVVHEDLAVQPGKSALVAAASGGTGTFAVKLAAALGARGIVSNGR